MRIRWTTTREDGFLAFSYSFLLWAIVVVAAATGGVDSFVVSFYLVAHVGKKMHRSRRENETRRK